MNDLYLALLEVSEFLKDTQEYLEVTAPKIPENGDAARIVGNVRRKIHATTQRKVAIWQ